MRRRCLKEFVHTAQLRTKRLAPKQAPGSEPSTTSKKDRDFYYRGQGEEL
jgi:hypothetical protein